MRQAACSQGTPPLLSTCNIGMARTITCVGNRLDWKCGDRTEEELWKQFDCDWEGALLRPGNMSLREAKDVYEVNKDLWVDSMEISQVIPPPPQDN